MPIQFFLKVLAVEIFLLLIELKLVSLTLYDKPEPTKKKVIKLRQDNFPFEEGSSVDWYQ